MIWLLACVHSKDPNPHGADADADTDADADADADTDADVDSDTDADTDPVECAIFPPDNPWNTDVSGYDVHPDSDTFIDSIGRGTTLHPDFGTVWAGAPNGIPWVEVPSSQPRVPVEFRYGDESD
ncbi:MAG: hypothetical protein ABMA64_31940, partial [Myxococcota bacterium]